MSEQIKTSSEFYNEAKAKLDVLYYCGRHFSNILSNSRTLNTTFIAESNLLGLMSIFRGIASDAVSIVEYFTTTILIYPEPYASLYNDLSESLSNISALYKTPLISSEVSEAINKIIKAVLNLHKQLCIDIGNMHSDPNYLMALYGE